jgi:hypothetical protein
MEHLSRTTHFKDVLDLPSDVELPFRRSFPRRGALRVPDPVVGPARFRGLQISMGGAEETEVRLNSEVNTQHMQTDRPGNFFFFPFWFQSSYMSAWRAVLVEHDFGFLSHE